MEKINMNFNIHELNRAIKKTTKGKAPGER